MDTQHPTPTGGHPKYMSRVEADAIHQLDLDPIGRLTLFRHDLTPQRLLAMTDQQLLAVNGIGPRRLDTIRRGLKRYVLLTDQQTELLDDIIDATIATAGETIANTHVRDWQPDTLKDAVNRLADTVALWEQRNHRIINTADRRVRATLKWYRDVFAANDPDDDHDALCDELLATTADARR